MTAATGVGTPDIDGLSGLAAHVAAADRFVERAVAAYRAVARAEAARTALLAEAHAWAREVADAMPGASSRTGDLEVRDLAAQLSAALHLPDRTVQAQMDAAASLTTMFPATMAAWERGDLDRARVTAIAEAGAPIVDDDARGWYEDRALARAAELTAAQLRPAARALAEQAHPESLTDRHRRARERRRVAVTDLDDGMARVIADLPAPLAHGIHDRLTALAHEVRGAEADDTRYDAAAPAEASADEASPIGLASRSLDEVRADVFADLLLGAVPQAHVDAEGRPLEHIRAHVQVTIPVMTALGESAEPCLLAGQGPIPLDEALRLAGTATGWDRVLTSPIDGSVLAVDRYRPSEQLRRFLRARDEHCRFVGCRQAARRCDADHTVDHALGGATRDDNLATLCRRHHVLKHRSAWLVEQLGRGVLRWRSPAGRIYVDRPAPMVRFVPASVGDASDAGRTVDP